MNVRGVRVDAPRQHDAGRGEWWGGELRGGERRGGELRGGVVWDAKAWSGAEENGVARKRDKSAGEEISSSGERGAGCGAN